MQAPSSSALSGRNSPQQSQRRALRASSVPNLRERPGFDHSIMSRSPWTDEVFTGTSTVALPRPIPPAHTAHEHVATTQVALPTPAATSIQLRLHDGGGGWHYWWRRVTGFLGYGRGNEARKELVMLVFTFCWGMAQIASIVLLLTVSALSRSRINTSVNEWQACDKPLAPWAIIWCVRVLFGFFTAIWAYRISKYRLRARDVEGSLGLPQRTGPARPDFHVMTDTNYPGGLEPRGNSQPMPSAQRSKTLNRLTTFTSAFSLAWFIVAHVFLYSSLSSCKIASPHLWWAVFGIVCIGYIVVAEVFLVGFVVFILVPLIFLVINIILVCLGRRPLLPGNDIHPEVQKLSQRLVDQIPLVLYIPHPPTSAGYLPAAPLPAHTYPPNAVDHNRASASSRSSLFKFLRKKRTTPAKGKSKDSGQLDNNKQHIANSWEETWEKGEYPFVRLEDNRAACAICLMDFEPPKKINQSVHNPVVVGVEDVPELFRLEQVEEDEAELAQAVSEEEDNENLRLQDAGVGVQPLRLLSCGHVFHKTCLDPWLLDVSGRCPTCQQRVEILNDEPGTRKRRRGRRS